MKLFGYFFFCRAFRETFLTRNKKRVREVHSFSILFGKRGQVSHRGNHVSSFLVDWFTGYRVLTPDTMNPHCKALYCC